MVNRIILLVLLIIFIPGMTSQAEAPTPGSANDPVITKSYLDQNSLSEAKVKEIVASVIATNASGSQPSEKNGGSTSTPAAMTVVELKSGQTLYAGEGTEVIVRTGKTLAVSKDENGIPDVTSGKDIAAGSAVETNHLLIFPREGRGIKPDAKSTTNIYVMVRGGYLILNADGSKAQ